MDRKHVTVSTTYELKGPFKVELDEYVVSNREKGVFSSVLKATDKLWIVPMGPKGDEAVRYFHSLDEAVKYIDEVNS